MISLSTLFNASQLFVNEKPVQRLYMTYQSSDGSINTDLIWTNNRFIELHYHDAYGNQYEKKYSSAEFIEAGGSLTAFSTHRFDDTPGVKTYVIAEPFATVLSGDMSNLDQFYDNSKTIVRTTDYCFYDAANLTQVSLPAVNIINGSFVDKCPILTYVNISSVLSIGTDAFNQSYDLERVYIDNNECKSFPDGYGKSSNALMAQKINMGKTSERWALKCTIPYVTKISCDEIGSIVNQGMTQQVVDAVLINLSVVTSGLFANAYNLSSIHVDNSKVKSFFDDFGYEGILLTHSSTKVKEWDYLAAVTPLIRNVSINSISSFEPTFNTGGQVSSLNISNDIFHPINNGELLVDALSSKLYFCGVLDDEKMDIINSIESISAFNQNLFRSRKNVLKTKNKIVTLSNIVEFGDYCFYNVTGMDTLIAEKCQTLGKAIFQNNTGIHHLVAPELTAIPESAFQRQKSSTYPKLLIEADKVKSIGKNAFLYRWGMEYISFPEVTQIDDTAFSQCESIAYANIPKAEIIGTNAFYNCILLSSINISAVTSFDNYANNAFKGCNSLYAISCNNVLSADVMNNYSRIGWNEGCSCYCQEGMIVI